MGGPQERRARLGRTRPRRPQHDRGRMRRRSRRSLLPRSPGLPDEAFHHDGQLTKREVRAATLAALAPVPGQLLWDVGAGCGSIAIEWMRHRPRLPRHRHRAAPRPSSPDSSQRRQPRLPALDHRRGQGPGGAHRPATARCSIHRRRHHGARPVRDMLAGAAARRPAGRQCRHASRASRR